MRIIIIIIIKIDFQSDLFNFIARFNYSKQYSFLLYEYYTVTDLLHFSRLFSISFKIFYISETVH